MIENRLAGGNSGRACDRELDHFSVVLPKMGRLVISQVNVSVAAVLGGGEQLAARIIQRERGVDARDGRLEELAGQLLACRQPMGSDRGAALSSIKSGRYLERCGGEAEKLAHIAEDIARGNSPAVGELGIMVKDVGERSTQPLTDTLNALHDGVVGLAVVVAEADETLGYHYRDGLGIFHEHDEGKETRRVVTELVLAANVLERVGGQAKNIADCVVCAVGKRRPARKTRRARGQARPAGGGFARRLLRPVSDSRRRTSSAGPHRQTRPPWPARTFQGRER